MSILKKIFQQYFFKNSLWKFIAFLNTHNSRALCNKKISWKSKFSSVTWRTSKVQFAHEHVPKEWSQITYKLWLKFFLWHLYQPPIIGSAASLGAAFILHSFRPSVALFTQLLISQNLTDTAYLKTAVRLPNQSESEHIQSIRWNIFKKLYPKNTTLMEGFNSSHLMSN